MLPSSLPNTIAHIDSIEDIETAHHLLRTRRTELDIRMSRAFYPKQYIQFRVKEKPGTALYRGIIKSINTSGKVSITFAPGAGYRYSGYKLGAAELYEGIEYWMPGHHGIAIPGINNKPGFTVMQHV